LTDRIHRVNEFFSGARNKILKDFTKSLVSGFPSCAPSSRLHFTPAWTCGKRNLRFDLHEEIPRFFAIDFTRRTKKTMLRRNSACNRGWSAGSIMNWIVRLYDSGVESDPEESDYHIRLEAEMPDTTKTTPHPDSSPSCGKKPGPLGSSAHRRKRRTLKARAGK
jgi:hypothetical protein